MILNSEENLDFTKPLFSIVMPAYNAEKTIQEAIDSVFAQTLKNYELIIVNDCSYDSTQKIIEKNASRDKRISVLKNKENLGVARSRNKALKIAKGRYIAFLDSDDLWMPNKLEKQYEYFCAGYDVVYSAYTRFKGNKKKIIIPPKRGSFKTLLRGNYIGNLTGAYDREKIGLIMQKSIGHEDYLMWLSIMAHSEKSIGLQESLAKYRVGENTLSSNVFKGAKWTWRIYREELELSFFKSLYLFFYYLAGSAKKRCNFKNYLSE